MTTQSPYKWILFACIFGFFSVALGAFGAHALAAKLSEKGAKIFQTATQYQMFHCLALLALGLFGKIAPDAALSIPGNAFSAGILLFSGSLYLLSLTELPFFGAITPIGGVLFLLGWFTFGAEVWRQIR